MATVTITIPDALVPRVVAAMRAGFPQYSSLTDVAAFKKVTSDYWRAVLSGYESQAAYNTAAATAATDGSAIG